MSRQLQLPLLFTPPPTKSQPAPHKLIHQKAVPHPWRFPKGASFDSELSAVKPTSAHSALTTIVNDSIEMKILRDNMPFGRASLGEFGTYFIGYSRFPHTLEQMLENMFVGRPSGNYDRLLDYSRPVTGALFFAPTQSFLGNLDDA
jgi:Dyp-type peroxidase family